MDKLTSNRKRVSTPSTVSAAKDTRARDLCRARRLRRSKGRIALPLSQPLALTDEHEDAEAGVSGWDGLRCWAFFEDAIYPVVLHCRLVHLALNCSDEGAKCMRYYNFCRHRALHSVSTSTSSSSSVPSSYITMAIQYRLPVGDSVWCQRFSVRPSVHTPHTKYNCFHLFIFYLLVSIYFCN